MTAFVVVVGIVSITLVLVMQYARTQQEQKAWNDFAQDDFRSMALGRPLRVNAVTKADGVKSSPGSRANRYRELTVVRMEDESPDCRSFYFAAPDNSSLPIFFGGQYLVVSMPDPDSPGHSLSRCYSLSDGVQSSTYRITVKRVPGGKLSNLLHDSVQVGDRIRVQLPSGRFHIGKQSSIDESGRPRPLNLIAAGIGITPMLSMLRECLTNTPERTVRLFYQLRDASNAPFLEELRRLAAAHASCFRLFVALSKPRTGDLLKGDLHGRMDAVAILGAAGSAAGNFMICGPDGFMQTIAVGLTSRGVPQSCVEFESFAGPVKSRGSIANKTADAIVDVSNQSNVGVATQLAVRFKQSACDAVWTSADSSLLELAERSGVPIDSACRSGQCGSCVVRLLAGQVRYTAAPDLEGLEPDEALACVACPTSDIVIDA